MARLTISSRSGSSSASISLGEAFDAPLKHELLRAAVMLRTIHGHQRTGAVKTRAQVSGSRRKLYRQKGTGRARPGDAKSVQRRGGGIAHGPVSGKRSYKMNKTARRAAFRSAIAQKIRDGQVKVVEEWVLKTPKTAVLAKWLREIGVVSALLVFVKPDKNLVRAASNLPGVHTLNQRMLDVYGVLSHEWLVFSRDALKAMEERLAR